MTPSEARYAPLVRLAWELHAIPVNSWLVLLGRAEPVLYVPGNDGRKDAIVALPHTGRWLLLWRGTAFDGGDLRVAARRIAMGAAR
jgi:hypothetical protein